jgi:hypothetical protein
MLFVLAHAGHWLPDLLIFGGPVVIGVVAIKWADRRERGRTADQANQPAAPGP